MKLVIADMDVDGKLDIVASGKSGLYIFYNKGVPPKRRGKNLLPDETTYPSWIPWETSRAAQQPDKEGFVALFNGKDLTGWGTATNWAVENGLIVLNGRTDRQEHNDNYLWTRRPYGDFVLDLEFKAIQSTNSGVFLRTSDTKDPVYTGIEVQIGAAAAGRPLGEEQPGCAL